MMVSEIVPPADESGHRFIAPSARPTSMGIDAAACAKAAGLPVRLDRTMALLFLASGDYDAHRSFFEGVGMVPPRCPVARRADGTLRVEAADAPPKLRLGFDEAARGLRAVITASVEASIGSARRVGILLSGGLDSSIVTAAASEVWRRQGRAPDDLRLYHVLPEGPTEVEHARAVARHLGHPILEIPADDGDPFEGNDVFSAAIDFAIGSIGIAQILTTWRRMADDGVEVHLNGEVGDELGNDYLQLGLWTSLRCAVRPALRPLWRAVRRWRDTLEHLPDWLRERVRGLPSIDPEPPARRGLRGVAAARDGRLRGAMIGALASYYRALDCTFGTRSALPFASPQVVDFAVSIPQQHLMIDPPKALMRRAFSDALPQAQRDRPKDQPEYEPSFRRQIERFGAAWFERYVHGGVLERLDIVPRGATASILSAAVSGSYTDLHRALRCVHLGAWWRAREANA